MVEVEVPVTPRFVVVILTFATVVGFIKHTHFLLFVTYQTTHVFGKYMFQLIAEVKENGGMPILQI